MPDIQNRGCRTMCDMLLFYGATVGIVIFTTVPPPSRGVMTMLPPHIISSLCENITPQGSEHALRPLHY